ncbi:hypothetical protein AMC99_02406 [Altererythrobacter epoxidivorans]|uniref:Uncharacterized protein n=1 Tax=Altererythrobacter epoxidivorans TaxID=361183 RepID=A0A0M5L7E3_9SPHN|nr:hypothetical protein [Altererythrobacter epoxidivorans]ALE17681.1 hypothetical protein AMC99_02406 [Altererythrobacter epoxidivorans]
MSNVITLTRAVRWSEKVAEAKAEVIRFSLVASCAVALIAADRALPF